MLSDEYDSSHFNEYDYIIDFYKNSNIQTVIKKIYKDTKCETDCKYDYMSQKEENEKLSTQIIKTIFTLKEALNVLENRYITNIGSRVFHYIIEEENARPVLKCYLIQVWRS